jgi:hypothetical protein
MKRIFSILIKVALLAGLGYVIVQTNPNEGRHKESIIAKQASLAKKDLLGESEGVIYQAAPGNEPPPFTYHNYLVCSKVTGPENEMVSFGFFNTVFVTKSKF